MQAQAGAAMDDGATDEINLREGQARALIIDDKAAQGRMTWEDCLHPVVVGKWGFRELPSPV